MERSPELVWYVGGEVFSTVRIMNGEDAFTIDHEETTHMMLTTDELNLEFLADPLCFRCCQMHC